MVKYEVLGSKEALVKVFTLTLYYLRVHRLFVLDLRLGLPKLNIRGLHVRVLRLVEFISEFKLLLQDGQVGPADGERGDVLLGDLRLNSRGHHRLLFCFLH